MDMEEGSSHRGRQGAPLPPPGHTDCYDEPPTHFSKGDNGPRDEMGLRKANTLSYKLYCTCAKAR